MIFSFPQEDFSPKPGSMSAEVLAAVGTPSATVGGAGTGGGGTGTGMKQNAEASLLFSLKLGAEGSGACELRTRELRAIHLFLICVGVQMRANEFFACVPCVKFPAHSHTFAHDVLATRHSPLPS